MKNNILLTLILCSCTLAQAQVKLALQGGLNLNSISWKDKDDINSQSDSSDYTYSSTKGKQGFHVSLNVLIHTEENWYFETGLGVSKKGGTTQESTIINPGNKTFVRTQFFSPSYLQIPLYITYIPEIRKKYKVTASAGLYLGFGVGGKYESSTIVNNGPTVKVNRKAQFGIDLTDEFAKVEFGYGAKVGFLMSDNICFSAGLQRSFITNAPKVKEQNGSAIHNAIQLSITKFIKR